MPDPTLDRPPGAVPLETLIARFDGIHQFRQAGRRAPNKPLPLLYAPARLKHGRQTAILEPPGQRSLWQLSDTAASLDASGNRKLDKQEPRERLHPAVVAIMAVGLYASTKPEDGTDRPFRS